MSYMKAKVSLLQFLPRIKNFVTKHVTTTLCSLHVYFMNTFAGNM